MLGLQEQDFRRTNFLGFNVLHPPGYSFQQILCGSSQVATCIFTRAATQNELDQSCYISHYCAQATLFNEGGGGGGLLLHRKSNFA